MNGSGSVIGRLFGIEIRANRSWIFVVVVAALVVKSWMDYEHPAWSGVTTTVAGVVASAMFFGSVIVHELAHCLVARRFGIEARSISLNFFGGFSWLSRQALRPVEELSYTIAGPASNLVIAGLCGLGILAVGGQSDVVRVVLEQVAWLNVSLAAFNMIPGAPLDGGRVVRSAVWWATGSYEKGTIVSSIAGQAVGALVMMGGLAIAFTGELGGLLVALLGYYLLTRARQGLGEIALRRALAGLTVRNLWLDTLPTVERSESLSGLLNSLGPDNEISGDPHFMVVDAGVIYGVLPASRVMQVDSRSWDATIAGDLMTPIDKIEKLSFQTDIMRAMEAIYASDMNELPVVDENVVQGFVGREALLRFVASRLAANANG